MYQIRTARCKLKGWRLCLFVFKLKCVLFTKCYSAGKSMHLEGNRKRWFTLPVTSKWNRIFTLNRAKHISLILILEDKMTAQGGEGVKACSWCGPVRISSLLLPSSVLHFPCVPLWSDLRSCLHALFPHFSPDRDKTLHKVPARLLVILLTLPSWQSVGNQPVRCRFKLLSTYLQRFSC